MTLPQTLPVKLAVTTAALLLLAACGGNSDDSSKTSSSSSPSASSSASSRSSTSSGSSSDFGTPATGAQVTGTGYTYHLPSNWEDISAQLKKSQPGIDSGGRENPATPPFTANLNTLTTKGTITGTPTKADLTELATQIKKEVATLSPNVKTLANTTIDGQPAVHQEGAAKQGSTNFFLVQYFVVKSGTNYGITFAFPSSLTQAQRDKIVDPVLASFSFS